MVYKKKYNEKGTKNKKNRVTINSIVPTSYKYSLVPLQLVVHRVNEGIESMF